jgi:SOS response regulatory protein OraA/RecX
MNYDYLTDEELLRVINRDESSNVRTLCERLEKKINEFNELTDWKNQLKTQLNYKQLSLFEG